MDIDSSSSWSEGGMLNDWVLSKLEAAKESPRILVKDPLNLLHPRAMDVVYAFAKDNEYKPILASTNLVFREQYEEALSNSEIKKILVVDLTPMRRISNPSPSRAPPLFYPDLQAETADQSIVNLDLREFLKDITGDPNWPLESNQPIYARLMAKNLKGVIQAHENLRTSDPRRFTDYDFKTILAYSALGIPHKAFRHPDFEDLWKIGLLKHRELMELEKIAKEITNPIIEEFSKAEPPFCWFADHDPETVVRAFYLSVILAQHLDNWQILLPYVDPSLKSFVGMNTRVLKDAAPKLVDLDPVQADIDLRMAEDSLESDYLKSILIDLMTIDKPSSFVRALENENYSTLIRSLAILSALEDLLSSKPAISDHEGIHKALFDEGAKRFVDNRESKLWSDLKEAYRLAYEIRIIRENLFEHLRLIRVDKAAAHSYDFYWKLWNQKKINRLEYYISSLVRLVDTRDLLPRSKERLPQEFPDSRDRIIQRIRELSENSDRLLDEINIHFQEMVRRQYPTWISQEGEVVLTSQFLRRCLKPNWDPETEKAVVLIFDGMRYDIWDEMFRPMLADRMEQITEYLGSSLLPTETHISRKAISAGAYPDEFDTGRGENLLLKDGLAREFRYDGDVQVLNPESSASGETVRYRAGNLDVYIFELCDSELHKIKTKTLPDGRVVSQRPLALIYQQRLKDTLETEVMSIIRNLDPGTKVFVTADHGFTRVGRQPIWFPEEDLNDPRDCMYLNCKLKVSPTFSKIPDHVKENFISFPADKIRMPTHESRRDKGTGYKTSKKYEAIAFPRMGYFFSREIGHYPDAFTHGGISMQEMMIPMVVLQVKSPQPESLIISDISGPRETFEGEEMTFGLHLCRPKKVGSSPDELRIDLEASCSYGEELLTLPQKVIYLASATDKDIVYRLCPDLDNLDTDLRRKGEIMVSFNITLLYREGHRMIRKSRTQNVQVKLDSEKLIRRVGNLGCILGLTPRTR